MFIESDKSDLEAEPEQQQLTDSPLQQQQPLNSNNLQILPEKEVEPEYMPTTQTLFTQFINMESLSLDNIYLNSQIENKSLKEVVMLFKIFHFL